MGLSQEQIHAIEEANQRAYSKILASLRSHDGYNWQAFGAGDGVSRGVSQSSCASDMRSLCARGASQMPTLMSDGGQGKIAPQVIASFLIARGDHWWM